MMLERLIVRSRDLAIWVLGVAGIVHQEVTGHVKPELLLVYISILTIPGGISLFTLRRSGGLDTPASPSPSVESPHSDQPSL